MTKKDLILRESKNMFLKYGIHTVSMDDIATKCGVSKRTIYQFFENKSDLLGQIVEAEMDNSKRRLERITKESPNAIAELLCFFNYLETFFSSLSPTVLRDVKRFHIELYIKLAKFKKSTILPFMEKNIERGKKDDLYKSGLNVGEMSKTYLKILDALLKDGDMLQVEEDMNSLSFINNLFIHRLVTTKGLDRLAG